MQITFTVGFDVCGLMLISSIILQGKEWQDCSPSATWNLTRKTVKVFVLQSSVTGASTIPEVKWVLWPN